MQDSETFGIETIFAERAIEWMNEQAKKNNWKFEARTYNSEIKTKNFIALSFINFLLI